MDLENLVYDLKQANQDCVVVTGTILPRKGTFDDEEAYIEKVFKVDSLLSLTHLHFLVDAFYGNSGAGGGCQTKKRTIHTRWGSSECFWEGSYD